MQNQPSQPPAAALVPDALLKMQTVTAVTGLAETTLRRLVAAGSFPAPVNVAQRCTRWRAGAVTAWLQAQCQ